LVSILQEIVTNHQNLLTNDKIKTIIRAQIFFSNLRVLLFVLNPLRKAVLTLKSRSATLADCFLSLAAVLNKLPKSFDPAFHSHCAKVINKRCVEFDDDNYVTCFFLDPQYRNAPLKKYAFRRILLCAASIGKRLGFDYYKCETLCDQIIKYKDGMELFDLDTTFARDNLLN